MARKMANETNAVEMQLRSKFQQLLDYVQRTRPKYEVNQKLEKMAEVILKCHKSNSRGLCLVRTRHHVKAIYEYFNEHDLLKANNIKPTFLIGANAAEVDGIKMNPKQQQEAIKRFRNASFNLLVATDIAQEGLDIPECNYVIRYEFVSNEIGTVQSRGRVRAEKGQTFLITVKNSLNDKREQENRLKEECMKAALREYSQMSSQAFELDFNSYMKKLDENKLSNKDEKKSSQACLYEAERVKILCRDCGRIVCNGSEIRNREAIYVCEQSVIDTRVKVVEKKFYCSVCKRELGKLLDFKNSKSLFIIDIKGVKFEMPDRSVGIQVISKWSKVDEYFSIKDFK
jgi:superfamily II DNA/RNA helicase